MRAILKREVKNYLKNPLLWLGIVSGVLMIFLNVRPYLNIHYLREGETIVYDEPETYGDADVYCGYVPTEEGLRRGLWEERIQETLSSVFGMDNEGAQSVIDEMKGMDVSAACAHLEGYGFYGAYNDYVDTAYRKGTREEINAYIAEKLENRTFSYYFVSVYSLFSLLFKSPLPAVPFLFLYIVYSNMGSRTAEGGYVYYGMPLAIMVRFPGKFFDTAPPPMALPNQCFLILAAICIFFLSMQIWKRRRVY